MINIITVFWGRILFWSFGAYEGGGLSRYIGPVPESQEGAYESLKDPVDVLFLFFFHFIVFSTIFSLFRIMIL